MKPLITLAVTITTILLYGCKKESEVGASNSVTNSISYDVNGTAAIEGRIGFFSIPPPRYGDYHDCGRPIGYELGEYHWITADSPQCTYMVHLSGDYGKFQNKYVQVTGSWRETIQSCGITEFKYIELSVDSLKVVQ
jgi:hypothetical protein